jgi:hypothetical protein
LGSPPIQPEQDQESGLQAPVQPWTEKGREPSAAALEKAAFVEHVLHNQKAATWEGQHNFQATIYELLDAVARGVSVLEIDWTIEDGKYVPAGTRRVPWSCLGFEQPSNIQTFPHSNSNALRLFPDRDPNNPKHFEKYPHKFLVGVYRGKSGHIAAVGGVGAWSGAGNTDDPIAEIDAQIEALATDTGMMPNRIVIGLPAWAAIRHNPQVIARFPGAASVGVTRNQFASLLLNPDLDIRVGVLSYDENKWGKEKSAKNIVGSEMYLFHGNNTPTLYDPCFMKTFRTRRGGVDVVRTYREESSRSDVLAVDWTEDIKLTSGISAKRITVS